MFLSGHTHCTHTPATVLSPSSLKHEIKWS
uniref:Uncharacterized protein n=1 Tax=Anguilla anguilla TaxID=7936 RepID=A0A0E9Q809_ANGAN